MHLSTANSWHSCFTYKYKACRLLLLGHARLVLKTLPRFQALGCRTRLEPGQPGYEQTSCTQGTLYYCSPASFVRQEPASTVSQSTWRFGRTQAPSRTTQSTFSSDPILVRRYSTPVCNTASPMSWLHDIIHYVLPRGTLKM